MTKMTTNLLGILITILAGTYFDLMYCASCNTDAITVAVSESTSKTAGLLQGGVHVSGAVLLLTSRLVTSDRSSLDHSDNMDIDMTNGALSNHP